MTQYRELGSPFSNSQLSVSLSTRVDTRYRARQASLATLAGSICDWLHANPGHCIVYFPSYAYMAQVLELIAGDLAGRDVRVQAREMRELEKQELLSALRSQRDIAAFCILGGVFGEGVDLPGDALRSVVIVGVGLPQFNRRQEALRDYYEARYGEGFSYAYQYPGMQKVAQAMGRVIRSESDRGAALLIDSRFGQPGYRSLLPDAWDYREV